MAPIFRKLRRGRLSARIAAPVLARRILGMLGDYVAGAQPTADYAMSKPAAPMLTFGYGSIDAEAIRVALRAFGKALARLR